VGGPDAEVRFLRDFRPGGLRLAELTDTDVARMADLAERYADLRLGGTDASVIAIAERLGIHRIATFDRRHFTGRPPRPCRGVHASAGGHVVLTRQAPTSTPAPALS
jgi:hypothetical protein